MRLFKKTIIALLLLTFYAPSFAANNDAFAELDQATQKAKRPQSEKNQEFIDYINKRLDEYEQWREDYTKDLDNQRQTLIKQWGSAEVSDKTTDVEYNSDDTVKKVIDYDNNTATVSVLVDSSLSEEQAIQLIENTQLLDGEAFNTQDAEVTQEAVNYSQQREEQEKSFILDQTQQQMNEYDVQAERLISAGTGIPDEFIYQRAYGKKMALIDEAKKRMLAISKLYQAKRKELGISEIIAPELTPNSEAPTTPTVAEEPAAPAISKPATQVAKTPAPDKLTPKENTKVVNIDSKSTPEVASEANLTKENLNKVAKTEATTNDSVAKVTTPKKVISYKIKLPNNSLAKRASEYQPIALEESGKWSVDPALVMAIMHSESAFRPDAKSHVPAFGLMQIVPSSAGRDVNKQVRNIDAPMEVSELYQPPINVETGTAYLHILNSKYLKNIENDKSRLYCTIAAYNTGAGNVARAFNSNRSTNINTAAKKINEMTPDQVYTQLINNLPYDETKNYLKKVSSRMALYQAEKPQI